MISRVELSRFTDVYPNPLRSGGTFTLSVGKSQDLRVEIFDQLGRSVRVVFDGEVLENRPYKDCHPVSIIIRSVE